MAEYRTHGSSQGATITGLDVRAGDYVVVLSLKLTAAEPEPGEFPEWLTIRHNAHYVADGSANHRTVVLDGFAPTGFQTFPGSTARILIAFSDVDPATIQYQAGQRPNPTPGFNLPTPSFVLFASTHIYATYWQPASLGDSTPPGAITQARALPPTTRTTLQARLLPAGETGELPTESGTISGARGTGLAIAFSALGPRGAPRVRSSVSEDAGSLFQATQAAAVELGISEAFEYGADLGGGLRVFREALTPELVALRYYAVPTRNQEMLSTVEGETNLGRLAHTIAPRIFTRGTGIPGNDGGVVTAQQAIQHVVNRWQSEHTWLVFAPVPDLRLLVPEAVADPRQHYLDNPDDGIITTSNVVIEQEGNERRTMREVLDEWLAIFPGTIVRQTSGGAIELVPRVGPDAPDGPALQLAWRDLARMSDGEDDPTGITNRARVTSQGWDWVEEQALIAPSFTVVRGENGLARSVLDSEEVLPEDREEFEPWAAVEFEVMASQDAVEVDVGLTAFGSWSQNSASNFSVEGTTSHNFTLLPGQRRDVTLQHTSRSNNVVFRTRVTRAPEGDRITLSWPNGVPADARNIFGITFLAYEVTLDVTGTAWTRSNQEIVGEFGQDGVGIPAVGGGDAIQQSRALHGERLAELRSTIFQLDNPQAEAVAQSYVLHNINPRTVRDVQQSEWDKYPVKFDHTGRYVELPNGEVAVVENRSYSDSFAPRASAMMSGFTATVSHSVIDTSTQYLFNSDGSYWENDDGTISEVL